MKPLTKIDHEGFRMAQSLAEGLLDAKSDYSGAFTPGDRLLTNFQTQKLQKSLRKSTVDHGLHYALPFVIRSLVRTR